MKPFVNVVKGPIGDPFPCLCCHFVTLSERGGDDICPVCFWEDDGQDDHDADDVRGGPNYSLSRTEAQLNFLRIGAAETSCPIQWESFVYPYTVPSALLTDNR